MSIRFATRAIAQESDTPLVISNPSGNTAVLYVDCESPTGNDGRNWAGAYKYLQDALTRAASMTSPVELRIAQGTYHPDTSSSHPQGTHDRAATFRLANVILTGGYAGLGSTDPNARDVDLYPTVLSGDLNGDDAESTPIAILWAVSTRADNSLHVITGSAAGPATIRGLTITGGNANSKPDAIDGGAVFSDGNSYCISMEHCTLTRNSALGKGGAICQYGHGDAPYTCGEILACKFSFNDANEGGAVANLNGSSTCENSIFLSNVARKSGAAVYLRNLQHTMHGCTLAWNYCRNMGGCLVGRVIDGEIVTEYEPFAGAVFYDNASLTLTNSVLWNNCDAELSPIAASMTTAACCIVQSTAPECNPTTPTIDVPTANGLLQYSRIDPRLTPDGHLRHDSPCIGRGDTHLLPARSSPFDVDGENRVTDGRLDLGADEFIDTDEDHLPDWWEHKYYADPNADPDDDALTNLDEYSRYGSDPARRPLYVDCNNADDAFQDGTSGHPFSTLQAGLKHAANGDTVIVAPGTYVESSSFEYGGKAVALRSREGVAHTIIAGGSSQPNVCFASGESPGAAVVGFTVSTINCHYSSPQIRDCVIQPNDSLGTSGSGLCIIHGAPLLADCTIAGGAPDLIWVMQGCLSIEGTVGIFRGGLWIFRSTLSGAGTLVVDSDHTDTSVPFALYGSVIQCNIDSALPISAVWDTIIESSATIDLHGRAFTGTSLLRVTDDARLLNTLIQFVRLEASDNAALESCIVATIPGWPCGGLFVEDNAKLNLSFIKSDSDRYLDLDPRTYDCNNICVDKIQITIATANGATRGGLFELRGVDRDAGRFEPDDFFCRLSNVPPFSPDSWTIVTVR